MIEMLKKLWEKWFPARPQSFVISSVYPMSEPPYAWEAIVYCNGVVRMAKSANGIVWRYSGKGNMLPLEWGKQLEARVEAYRMGWRG